MSAWRRHSLSIPIGAPTKGERGLQQNSKSVLGTVRVDYPTAQCKALRQCSAVPRSGNRLEHLMKKRGGMQQNGKSVRHHW